MRVVRKTEGPKVLAAVLVVLMAGIVVAGCGRKGAPPSTGPIQPPAQAGPAAEAGAGQASETVLEVFVPCAFADAIGTIAPLFEKEHPGVRINPNVENVGVLVPRILNGAKPDVFMCIGDKEVDSLQEAGLVDKRKNFCFTTVVLVVPQANPAKVHSLKDLAKPEVKTVAVGSEKLSVGFYARQILRDNGVWEKVKDKLVEPKFPVELLRLPRSGKVQASLAYAACFRAEGADKKRLAAGIKLIEDFQEDYCLTIACAAATIKGAEHLELGRQFIEFLTRPECQDIFKAGGFMRLDDPKCFLGVDEEPVGNTEGGASDVPQSTQE